ncbi:MopE-related protein [Corallococcus interemptor]|uniref:MopE-related protein n=1 Tax=Corallococcus interemptor TaxID=2316720 RepID=UPI00131506BA|nr:MopE-related protein [Corallococcus interemptor]
MAVLLSDAWSDDLRVQADAFEQTCDTAAVTSDAFTTSQPNKWQLRQSPLDLFATDADGDGFVAPDSGGTDCNDSDANIIGPIAWYPDDDGDGYGSSRLPVVVRACVGTALTASRTGDCNDRDPSIHPDQPEFRCDGQDDNCNDIKDEGFDLGGSCLNAFQCPGVVTCDPAQGNVQCLSAATPTAYFMDEDGDGKAGADAGVSCSGPAPGTTTEMADCDESSPFVAKGVPEVCDRLDNNCNGLIDEGTSCNYNWEPVGTGAGTVRWIATATNGTDQAWLVSKTGQIAHVDSDGSVALLPDCPGSWNAAWSSKTGQMFLAGDNGKLATRISTGCTESQTPDPNVNLTGIAGIENADGGAPTIYIVSSAGFIFKWTPPNAPIQIATTGVNLRAISARGDADTLFAVGARDFGVPVPKPSALRYSPADGLWIEEPLPSAALSEFLLSVHVLSRRFAYAAGGKGMVFERVDGVWRQLPFLSGGVDVTGIVAFSSKGLYASTQGGTIAHFNSAGWTNVYSNPRALRAITGTNPTHLLSVGDQGVVLGWRP